MSEEEKDEQVRDLLSGLGPVGPIPGDVADRIGAALEDLPAPAPAGNPRRMGRWLAAVAAIVVVAGGGTALVQHLNGGATPSAASAGSAADRATSQCSSCSTNKHAPADQQDLSALNGELDGLRARAALPRVRSAHFAHDVRALLGRNLDYAAAQRPRRSATKSDAGAAPDCATPSGVDRAAVTEIALDGRLAQLVVTGSGSDRSAAAYDCAGTTVLDTVSLGK